MLVFLVRAILAMNGTCGSMKRLFIIEEKMKLVCKKCRAVFLWDPDDKFDKHAKCPFCKTANK